MREQKVVGDRADALRRILEGQRVRAIVAKTQIGVADALDQRRDLAAGAQHFERQGFQRHLDADALAVRRQFLHLFAKIVERQILGRRHQAVQPSDRQHQTGRPQIGADLERVAEFRHRQRMQPGVQRHQIQLHGEIHRHAFQPEIGHQPPRPVALVGAEGRRLQMRRVREELHTGHAGLGNPRERALKRCKMPVSRSGHTKCHYSPLLPCHGLPSSRRLKIAEHVQ